MRLPISSDINAEPAAHRSQRTDDSGQQWRYVRQLTIGRAAGVQGRNRGVAWGMMLS
jgi:hypothetical protein